MELLQNSNSNSKRRFSRNPNNMNSYSFQKKSLNENENTNEDQNTNEDEYQNQIINKRENKRKGTFKKYFVAFYDMYGSFQKEADSMMKSFQYFTRDTNIEIIKNSKGKHADFHIILGKERIRDSTYAFSMIPKEDINITPNGRFTNITMIHIVSSPGNKICTPKKNANIKTFDEFPVYTMEFNTNHRTKFCPENDAILQELIQLITGGENVRKQNKNRNQSMSGSLFEEDRSQSQGVTVNVPSFQTKSIILKHVNELYYQLFPKNPAQTPYIKKEVVYSLFQKRDLMPILYDKVKVLVPSLVFQKSTILSAYLLSQNQNQMTLSQKSMEQHGSGFREFYQEKRNQFENSHLRKYQMALFYIQHLKHRNQPLYQASGFYPHVEEFQNSYYLGFDLEYILIQHLQKSGGKRTPLILPFTLSISNNSSLLYYLYIHDSQIHLYEMNHDKERNMKKLEDIHQKVDLYFKTIVRRSFLSKAPLKYVYRGRVERNIKFSLNFLDESILYNLYSHFHLFYQIINPNINIQQIVGNKANEAMSLFITMLLEM